MHPNHGVNIFSPMFRIQMETLDSNAILLDVCVIIYVLGMLANCCVYYDLFVVIPLQSFANSK